MKNSILYTTLALLLIVAIIVDLMIGSIHISLYDIWGMLTNEAGLEGKKIILYQFRIPRITTALLSGVSLSLSGLLIQTLFRNPLAGPDVLGITSGASFGVAILIMGSTTLGLQLTGMMGGWALVAAACLGTACMMMLILLTSMYIREINTILILGIMFGSALSAMVSIMQYFSDEIILKTYIIWTMGSLGGVTLNQLWVFIPTVFLGLISSVFLIKPLNALLLGESYARSLGLNYKRTRLGLITCTTLLTGATTAFCGPISFIGIAVPHITRFLYKTSDHRHIVPATIIIGALFMLFADAISQLPGEGQLLPINSITALFGAPVVIAVILKKRFRS